MLWKVEELMSLRFIGIKIKSYGSDFMIASMLLEVTSTFVEWRK
jgi:hypothetical protein